MKITTGMGRFEREATAAAWVKAGPGRVIIVGDDVQKINLMARFGLDDAQVSDLLDLRYGPLPADLADRRFFFLDVEDALRHFLPRGMIEGYGVPPAPSPEGRGGRSR